MKRMLYMLILLSVISISAMEKSWKDVQYNRLEANDYLKKTKCSKLSTCIKVAVPIAFYAASLGVAGYAAYYAGSELKASCNECSAKLKAAQDLVTAAQNCTNLVKYAVDYCPSAVQTCMNAFSQCWNGGN